VNNIYISTLLNKNFNLRSALIMAEPWSAENLTASPPNLTSQNLTLICGEEADSEVLDLYRYSQEFMCGCK